VLNVIFFCIFEFVWVHNIRNWRGSNFFDPSPLWGGFIVDLQKCPDAYVYSILTYVSLMSSSWLPRTLSQFLISLKLPKSITDVCWK